jgi:hypothetical protein
MHTWICKICISDAMPFMHLDTIDDYREALLYFFHDTNIDFNELNEKVFNPFEINDDRDENLFDVDPDYQYFADTQFSNNLKCDYASEDYFISNMSNIASDSLFSIYHHNIRTLPKNFTDFSLFLTSLPHKLDVVGLTETWLTPANFDLYDIDGYKVISKVRDKGRGGGVSLYINDSLSFDLRTDLHIAPELAENIFIEIDKTSVSCDKNIIVGLIYKPPNKNIDDFNNELSVVLQKLSRENKIVYLLGDYNIDLLKVDLHKPSSNFLDILFSYNLLPLINKPTRITASSATLIDNILCNDFQTDQQNYQGIVYSDRSDHFPIYHFRRKPTQIQPKHSYILHRVTKQENISSFKEHCANIDWDSIMSSSSTQDAYSTFHRTISDLYNTHFPIKKTKVGYATRKPWLTPGLKKSIRIKNKLYIRQLKSNNLDHIHYYKTYKNNLNRLLKKSERLYYQEKIENNKHNLKLTWKILKDIINKRKNHKRSRKFNIDGTLVENENIIAEHFNNFFSNVGPDLAKKIPNTNRSPLEFMPERVVNSIFLNPVTNSEIYNIIGNLNQGAAGWDEFSPAIIKQARDPLIDPLVKICNLSISQGVFPIELKLANIVPIYKSGDEKLINNYRPVSVLPVFSKILERIMYNRVLDFLDQYKILYEFQFGFRKGRSTEQALIKLGD